MAYSRQAAALLDSFKQFTLPFDKDTILDVLREDENNQFNQVMADLIEAQQDQIKQLQVKLVASQLRVAKLASKTKRR